jgi:glycine cleavage system regulatory protein
MQNTLVMTVIGPDRPGLVESVASLVASHGGNWLESRMSRLGGQFAGILRVEVPADHAGALSRELNALSTKGVTVVIHPDRVASTEPGSELRLIELIGQDRPGIVQQITSALAKHRVNVEELETECVSAAMSGETLFKARATVLIPASANVEALKAELEKIAADLIVEVVFQKVS